MHSSLRIPSVAPVAGKPAGYPGLDVRRLANQRLDADPS
jgi:hypothetical protein